MSVIGASGCSLFTLGALGIAADVVLPVAAIRWSGIGEREDVSDPVNGRR